MLAKSLFGVVACCGLLILAGGDDLAGVKCIMMGDEQVKKEHSVKYADGNVYFCCGKCAKSFEEDPAKYAIKAHHQLVVTGQYVQKSCPFSGGPLKEGVTTDVGGVKVGFCCEGCHKKVDGAKDVEAKANLVFVDAAFKKGFQKKASVDLTDVKCMMMPRDVKASESVKHREGNVYFCCGRCKKRYEGEPAKYAVQANLQLVSTGQYAQKACPITGRAAKDDLSVELADQTINLCCGGCKKKVEEASDDDGRAELLFADAAFEKGFEKKK